MNSNFSDKIDPHINIDILASRVRARAYVRGVDAYMYVHVFPKSDWFGFGNGWKKTDHTLAVKSMFKLASTFVQMPDISSVQMAQSFGDKMGEAVAALVSRACACARGCALYTYMCMYAYGTHAPCVLGLSDARVSLGASASRFFCRRNKQTKQTTARHVYVHTTIGAQECM